MKSNLIYLLDRDGYIVKSLSKYNDYFEAMCLNCGKDIMFYKDEFINGKRCSDCDIKKDDMEYINNKIESKTYEVIEFKNVNDIKIKHFCGKVYNIDFLDFNKHYCSLCSKSSGEKTVETWLINNNVEYEEQKTFNDLRVKNKLRFDFYIPSQNMCIEFNGQQHYSPIEFWGGDEQFELTKSYYKIKKNYCLENGMVFLEIKYDEDIEKKLKENIKID